MNRYRYRVVRQVPGTEVPEVVWEGGTVLGLVRDHPSSVNDLADCRFEQRFNGGEWTEIEDPRPQPLDYDAMARRARIDRELSLLLLATESD